MSLFLRLLGEEDKGVALLEAVRSVAAGDAQADPRVFEVDPTSFEQVPGAPFAYWVSNRIRSIFGSLEAFETERRIARMGLATADDFRFLRAFWEVGAALRDEKSLWAPFAKGGSYSPYYADMAVLLNWTSNGKELKAFAATTPGSTHWSRNIRSSDEYFKPGLTWPLRAKAFCPQPLPTGSIFSVRGYAILAPTDELSCLLGLLSSKPFDFLYKMLLGRFGFPEFVVGVLQQLPIPTVARKDSSELSSFARRAWSLKRDLDTATLTSHAFVLPALIKVQGKSLDARCVAWSDRMQQTEQALAEIQSEIDARCFDLYGFDEADRTAAMGADALGESGSAEDVEDGDGDEGESAGPSVDPKVLAAELFDWLVGVAFGRFDMRLATGEREPPPEPDPFDALSVCSPGMLNGEDGLPLASAPPGYPVAFPADGILVDDGDEPLGSARNDPITRIRSVLGILAAKMEGGASPGLAAETLEADFCRLLGVKTLGDWLRRPNGFFADHLGRWSKSRRKAPIVWPLSTESGAYTLWIYYPRLTDQTLYTCVNDHIDPKLKEIGSELERLRGNGDLDAKTRKRADALLERQREIGRLREELLRVARLPYKPDQNDGVLITAAPLWRLFRYKPWQKELAKCWDTLEAGGYDWAHLALALWPERVRTLCRTDKSVAIAHGLEDLYEG